VSVGASSLILRCLLPVRAVANLPGPGHVRFTARWPGWPASLGWTPGCWLVMGIVSRPGGIIALAEEILPVLAEPGQHRQSRWLGCCTVGSGWSGCVRRWPNRLPDGCRAVMATLRCWRPRTVICGSSPRPERAGLCRGSGLVEVPLLAVVGASGVGKFSLLGAGLFLAAWTGTVPGGQ
jgi:hypothetical protein